MEKNSFGNFCRRMLSFVLCILLIWQITTPAAAYITDLLQNSKQENQTILNRLQTLYGEDMTTEDMERELSYMGLLDESGNIRVTESIILNGTAMMLDEVRELLARPDTDMSTVVTVDGTVLTLGDLQTMIEIETQLEALRTAMTGGDVEMTEEHRDNLQSILGQIRSEGIMAVMADSSAPTSINHDLRIKTTASTSTFDAATLNGTQTVTVSLSLYNTTGGSTAHTYPITVKYRTVDGTAKAGIHYTANSGTITFASGETFKSFTVTLGSYASASIGGSAKQYPIADWRYSGKAVFYIQVYEPTNALLCDGTNADIPAFYQEVAINNTFTWPSVTGITLDGSPSFKDIVPSLYDVGMVLSNDEVLSGTTEDQGLTAVITGIISLSDDTRLLAADGMLSKLLMTYSQYVSLYPALDIRAIVTWTENYYFVPKASATAATMAIYANRTRTGLLSDPPSYNDKGYLNNSFSYVTNIVLTNDLLNAIVQGNNITTEIATATVRDTSYGTVNFPVSPAYIATFSYPLGYKALDGSNWYNTNGKGTFYQTMDMTYGNYIREGFYDETAPAAVIKADFSVPSGLYYPGQYIPVTVTFSEPVKAESLTITANSRVLSPADPTAVSKSHTFLYAVQEVDNTTLTISNISAVMDTVNNTRAARDSLGYVFLNGTNEGIVSTRPETALGDVTVTPGTAAVTDTTIGISVATAILTTEPVKKANYINAIINAANTGRFTASVTGIASPIALSAYSVGDVLTLEGSFTKPSNTSGSNMLYAVEILFDGGVVVGTYGSFEVESMVFAMNSELAVVAPGTWPSGETNKIKIVNSEQTQFAFTYNGDATFQNTATDFTWSSSDVNVATIDSTGKVTPVGQGKVRFRITAKNGGIIEYDAGGNALPAAYAESDEVTVSAEGLPVLMTPENGRTITIRSGEDALVRWTSNINYLNGEKPTTYTVAVYEGKFDKPEDVSGEPLGTYTVNATIEQNITNCTISADVMNKGLSVGGVPKYTVVVSAANPQPSPTQPETTLYTLSYIVVLSQPVGARFTEKSTYALDCSETGAANTLPITLMLKNYYAGEGDYLLTIDKNGSVQYSGKPSLSDIGGQTYTASYTLAFDAVAVNTLKDVYTISLKAKNNADNTWSYDSFVLYVYNNGALKILVNNADVGSTYTMSNIGEYRGKSYVNLAPEQIRQMRVDATLCDVISINYGDYTWNLVEDMISWASSDSTVASVNYQQGSLYENIENFEYSAYLASIRFKLSGLSDSSTTITATHANSGMKDTLEVNVQTLTDKLYMFQFIPMAETTMRYQTKDASGNTVERTVKTNSDGSIALYEENGITSDVRLESAYNGTTYMGTLYNQYILSGERDSTKLSLYPINTFELRQVARVDLYLKDGYDMAFTGEVKIRGGVYKNGGYCQDAAVNQKNGESDQIVALNYTDYGHLVINLDVTQFWSSENGENDQTVLTSFDDLDFIIELQFENGADGSFDDYYPALVYVDGNLNPDQIVRTADSVLNLEAVNGGKRPFIAVQNVEYTGTNRTISVKSHEGTVGPSSSYPEVTLSTKMLLWGLPTSGYEGYRIALEDEYGVIPKGQNSTAFMYPFSTIPIVDNSLVINENTIWTNGTDRVSIRTKLYDQENQLHSSIQAPYQITNMTAAETLEESEDINGALVTLQSSAMVMGSDDAQLGSDPMLAKALRFLGDREIGCDLFNMVISPTEDPTVFRAFIWMGYGDAGFGNTDSLGSPDDNSGDIFLEGSFNETEVGVTPSVSDMISMSKGTYNSEQSKELDEAMKNADAGRVSGGADASFTLQGFFEAQIQYNYDEGKWKVYILGGGFSAGVGASYEWTYNTFVGPVPVTASLKVGGALQIDFKAAVRYAQMTGLEWGDAYYTDDMVNDYLTNLRIMAYIRAFAGVGFDYSVIALKVGIFGQITVAVDNLFLSRTYLKDSAKRQINGQQITLTGEVGIEFIAKFLFVEYNKVLASAKFGKAWTFNKYSEIVKYWEDADQGRISSLALAAAYAEMYGLETIRSTATLESRNYLENSREWGSGTNTFDQQAGMLTASYGSGSRFSLMSLDPVSGLKNLQTNAYPYANPVLTSDGKMLVYVSDSDSSDVTDTVVCYTQLSGSSYNEGVPIPDNTGTENYGDSGLRLDGSGTFAATVWVRQIDTIDKQAGEPINTDEQALMLSSTEIMASIWNGTTWTTTRLTSNTTPDLAPVVAVSGGRVLVAWRSVYSADKENISDFSAQDYIVYRIYENGVWSDESVLYNGTSGSVMGLEAAMLTHGTAAVAYSLNQAPQGAENSTSYYEIVYAVIDHMGSVVKNVQVTSDNFLDENPQIATVDVSETAEKDERFVIGWHSSHQLSGVTTSDIRFAMVDKTGALDCGFPNALSEIVSSGAVSVDGNFRFVKLSPAINKLENLSLIWTSPAMTVTDGTAAESDHDILYAVKFIRYGGTVGISAAIKVAEMDSNTLVDHFDAYASDTATNTVKAVILATQYMNIDPTNPATYERYVQEDTNSYRPATETDPQQDSDIYVAKSVSKLLTATETYRNTFSLPVVAVDYGSLILNAPVPIQFTVRNDGLDPITKISIRVGDKTTDFTGLYVLPNQTYTATVYHDVGSKVENAVYTVDVTFGANEIKTTGDTVYLDIADVGISKVETISQNDGIREIQIVLYNQNAAELAGSGRVVRLGVYEDVECTKLYTEVTGQETGEALTINADADLTLIDSDAYSRKINFNLRKYISSGHETVDGATCEIPDGGVRLYFKVWIEESDSSTSGMSMKTAGEYYMSNNTANICFDNLMKKRGEAVSIDAELTVVEGNTTVNAILHNNSEMNIQRGNLLVYMTDAQGNLKVMQTYLVDGQQFITLKGGEEKTRQLTATGFEAVNVACAFGTTIAGVDSPNLTTLAFSGVTVGLSDFIQDTDGIYKATATCEDLKKTLVVAVPEYPMATVTVTSDKTGDISSDAAGANVPLCYTAQVITVSVLSADATASRTYQLTLTNYNTTPQVDPLNPEPVPPTAKYNYQTNSITVDVTASVEGGYTLSYQWYEASSVTIDRENDSKLDNETSTMFIVPTGLEVGEYYYYCAVSRTKQGETKEVASNVVTVSITKADVPTVVWPTVTTPYITFGQKLSDAVFNNSNASTVLGTFAWEYPNTIPTVDTAANPGYSVKFTASAETVKNYEEITDTLKNVVLAVNKAAAPSIVWPVSATLTYGQTLAQAVIAESSALSFAGTYDPQKSPASVYGNFAFADPTAVPEVANNGYAMSFTPSTYVTTNYVDIAVKTAIYKAADALKTLVVNRATPTVNIESDYSSRMIGKEITLTITVTNPNNASLATGFPEANKLSIAVTQENSTAVGSTSEITAKAGSPGVYTATYTLPDNDNLIDQYIHFEATLQQSANYSVGSADTSVLASPKYSNTITITPSSLNPTYGTSVIFNVEVTPGNDAETGLLPTGTVTFYLNSIAPENIVGAVQAIGTDPLSITLDKNTLTTIKGGRQYTVIVVYSGDESFAKGQASKTITVLQKKLLITAEDETAYTGFGLPNPKQTYNGFVKGENADVLQNAVVRHAANSDQYPGVFDIIACGYSDNYAITLVNGTLTLLDSGANPILLKLDKMLAAPHSDMPVITIDTSALPAGTNLSTLRFIITKLSPDDPYASEMLSSITGYNISADDIYDISIIDISNGGSIVPYTGAATLKFQYPTGTNQNNFEFMIVHGSSEGIVNYIPELTDDGLVIKTNGLSPFAVCYQTSLSYRYYTPGGVTTSAGSGGSVSGSNSTYQITAQPGYIVGSVYVDGNNVGAVDSYTFPSDGMTHTIHAIFLPIGAETFFKDVLPRDWYYDSVQFVVQKGLFTGTGSVMFSPNTSMTRAMLVTVLWRLDGQSASGSNGFTDVKEGTWYADAVAWASLNGIVNGVGGGKFNPDGLVTREQITAILCRYANYRNINTKATGNLDAFKDSAKISQYAADALRWAVGWDLIKGKTGSLLDPAGTASRAEVAAILQRFYRSFIQ
ncbi:MAG: S-layer homology domain-containing protein [Clostridiaceae bacterium]|nr:S-layer homology domain-containing protein [Clostridiaceae bacterium]